MNALNEVTAPVKEGQKLDLDIMAVGTKGDGIAKVEGFVIMVPGAEMGHRYKCRITRVLRKCGFAEIVG